MITDIPIEVLDEILRCIPTFDSNEGDLRTCCLINKFFYSIATPTLYYHLVLRTSSQGFKDHVVQSLLSKRYKSHHFIRGISIKWERVHGDLPHEGFWIPYDLDRAAIHIAAFIESLPEEQLQFINSETLDILKYLPSSYHSKIKSLECNPSERLSERPFFPSLRSLTFQDIVPYFKGLGSEWSLCQKYQHQLKSLSLKASAYEPNFSPETPFPNSPYLDFRTIEHFHLREFRNLGFKTSSILGLIPLKNIKKLELINCHVPPTFLVPQMPNFTNLTDLAVYPRFDGFGDTYTNSNIEDILLNLPGFLQSLHWAVHSNKISEYPSKKAIQRHSGTLRKLWLEISHPCGDSQRTSNWETSHYHDETKYKMLEIPISSRFDEVVDLETLSKFPRLEHLAVPIETPRFPNSWIPSFPKLRSLYLVNSCKIYCSKSRPPTKCFRQEWIHWFMSAYNLERPDGSSYPLSAYHRHPNLQLVAFQRPAYNWGNDPGVAAPQPGSRGFTAHLRDANQSRYFSKEAITSETVRRLYPEVWEFFKGYFMTENQKYALRSKDTNAAKGIFEDEDEFLNLPESFTNLQDYQMQLMLREQQNKKNLMMARAEQDALEQCPIEEPTPVIVRLLPWGVPKSLQEYQNDFLFYDEQAKKRREYVVANMQKYMMAT
ncbi:uncharacterized protein DFL_003000 [Arthrobotrys flagrans]|uniref:F-box domain-containing protein n=1 Tax=Arthrobotrys flagrans TaxID=97331 RepID=A0A437ACK6_ARTFL|nr:hypothetical protein DFL_003000 [Arthrobotrys flagrans]